MGSQRSKSLKSLKAGRPPLAKSSRTMSRKASRTLINKHHQLEKQRVQALKDGDKQSEARLASELADLGGLDLYQKASLQGQSSDRGGDTSRVLLEWLPMARLRSEKQSFAMLEVGALSTRNACSTSGVFKVEHIDLNSQEPGIQQQNFMERPLPRDGSQLFDIISLSLVLNFVPDAAVRGEMLRRTLAFLRPAPDGGPAGDTLFPCLFLVLPRSCVDNSRYFSDQRLEDIMTVLGFEKTRAKKTQKLDYSLWRRARPESPRSPTIPKQEINPGRTRNNFVITLERRAA
ncbi:25S rRNA adenine-N(1) methyltransferase [Escovopsis weberi]|uniref:25S rRNA adenine-N(1) methyltransferase n=1 Tax=Escovopsis weberi TaxID=150374 RepID=A0A0M8MPI6_ESCWE|nr:25S rRNA adenine-N(1) methyltransferase [Escovopsis weberi]